MKSFMFVSLILVLSAGILMAGGIVTNTNQSAAYMRTLNRNASTDVDAVYYNPAGLTKLEDGLHLSLSNQSIWQTKTVTNSYPNLNNDEFVGDVAAPLFPNLYLAYKMGNLVISGGFEPIGGGGSAIYEDGLPSFEMGFTDYIGLPASLIDIALEPYGNITGYSLDINFEGSSVYYGGQVGLTYGLNDMLSIAAGMRYVYAKNNYEGYLKNIALKTDGGIGDIAGVVPDKEVDAVQTGSGITGIFSANIFPSEMLNIGIRYETITKLELENDTKVDDTDKFPDGKKTNADIPAMLALGVSIKPVEKLHAELDFNYYMNTGVDWDWATRDTLIGTTAKDFLGNGYEIGLAVEYCLTDKILASIGFSYGDMGVKDEYQTDLSYSLPSTTIGLGIAYRISDNMLLNLGALNTFYQDGSRDGMRKNALTGVPNNYTEEYAKTNFGFALGIDYKF